MFGGNTIAMCKFLLQDTPGSHPTAWDHLRFRQNLPGADWSIKESHTPFAMHTYIPCTFQQPSLVPRLFFWNETTMHLPIRHAHPTG